MTIFSPYTEILTENGPKTLRDLFLRRNTKVYTFNEQTEELELQPIERVSMMGNNTPFYSVHTDNGIITMAADSLIWTDDGWHDLSCMRKGRPIIMTDREGRKHASKPHQTTEGETTLAMKISTTGPNKSVILANGAIMHT